MSLHRVAVHVLARRRATVTGRFGLRPTPGGFGTPAFGDPDHEEVLRIAGPMLVRERRRADGTHTTVHPLPGATLGELAELADVDLSAPFSVGRDTPAVGDPEEPLVVAGEAMDVLAQWLHVGALALDRLVATLAPAATPTVAQLWPEHFDLAVDAAAGLTRVNLGVSVGDAYSAAPYAYVGPWTPDRPGDPGFWNAPFGAMARDHELADRGDVVTALVDFFTRGLALLRGRQDAT
jgi:hypothetical protein